jgi:hypothetical protein
MHLSRTHPCHLYFHSSHYHLVIWGHLLLVLILFWTLIKSLTIWLLSDALLLPLLNFEINCSWRVSQHSKSKKFLRMQTRKPRSNLGDVINERDRWYLHTLEEIAQRKRSTKCGWCSRTSRLLPVIRSDPMPQVAAPLRDAHVRCSDVFFFLGPASMVER